MLKYAYMFVTRYFSESQTSQNSRKKRDAEVVKYAT